MIRISSFLLIGAAAVAGIAIYRHWKAKKCACSGKATEAAPAAGTETNPIPPPAVKASGKVVDMVAYGTPPAQQGNGFGPSIFAPGAGGIVMTGASINSAY